MWTLESYRWSRVFRCSIAAALAVLAAQPVLFAAFGGGSGSTLQLTLKFQPSSITGGDSESGTVTLSQPAPQGGANIKITVSAAYSSDVKTAPLTPNSLSIPAGATSVSFKVVTSPVSKKTVVPITATYNAITTMTTLTLEPTGIASVVIEPSVISAGGSATVNIELMHPAPPSVSYYKNVAAPGQPSNYINQVRTGGATVSLKATNGLTLPPSVQIAPGATSAEFSVGAPQIQATTPQASSCNMGPATTNATITATWEQAATGTLQVQPNSNSTSRYTSQTIRIQPGSILGVSHDGHALVLSGEDKCVASLKTGSVIFVNKVGVLKVNKLMKLTGGQLSGFSVPSGVALAVSSAALTDFINDGTFQIFKSTLADASQPSGPWAQALEPDQPVSGDDQWKYKTSGTGTSYSFIAFKQKDGLAGSVTANGQIAKFGYNFLAVIHGGKLQQATYKVDTDGTLDIDWNVKTTAPGQNIGESRLRLPALHSGLVDSADGIPLLFQVYANLIFKPGFGEKAAAQGHFRVTYRGTGGIDGASPVDEGLDATTEIGSTTSSAMAPHGAVIAVNAPKFALSLSTISFLWALQARQPAALNAKGADLADSLQGQLGSYVKADLMPPTSEDLFFIRRAAYVSWVTSVGYAGAGSLAMFPCQQYYQTFLTLAGLDKTMLGTISGSIPPDAKKGIQVFKKGKTTIIPLIKGCEPKQN